MPSTHTAQIRNEIYKIDAPLTMLDVASKRFRGSLNSRILMMPERFATAAPLVGFLHEQPIWLRPILLHMHRLRPETKRQVIRLRTWCSARPENVLWFLGFAEYERERYIVSAFCKWLCPWRRYTVVKILAIYSTCMIMIL